MGQSKITNQNLTEDERIYKAKKKNMKRTRKGNFLEKEIQDQKTIKIKIKTQQNNLNRWE